jgi:hypothetical protein
MPGGLIGVPDGDAGSELAPGVREFVAPAVVGSREGPAADAGAVVPASAG